MTIQTYFRVLARHWRLLMAITVLFAAAAIGITIIMPKVYTTTTTQFVRAVPGTGASADYQAAQFAMARAKSYSIMIGNPDVLAGIISDLEISMSPSEIFQRLSVDNPVDTALINVTARGRTPDEAQALSLAAASNLAKLIVRLESAGIANGKSPIDVQIAVPAPQPTTPSSPRPTLNIALGIMLGLAAGSLAGLTADLRRDEDGKRGGREPREFLTPARASRRSGAERVRENVTQDGNDSSAEADPREAEPPSAPLR